MRLLLALSCVACTATSTEPVVRRSADLSVAWDSTLVPRKGNSTPCVWQADTLVLWVDGMKYLEIVEYCL